MALILYVEDDDDNRVLLSRSMKRRGHTVITAEDGQAGVETCRARKPDLVIMDMGLPVMSGIEATRTLKSEPDTSDIPILALTAFAMPGDAQQTLDAGCDDYDSKPVDFDRLAGKVEALLATAKV